MDFHIRLNRKGQLNLGFIVAVMLLAFMIFGIVLMVLRSIPAFTDEAEQSNLRANAESLSVLLFEDPGNPINWDGTLDRVGLAKLDYSNSVVNGELDQGKISSLAALPYSTAKSSLNSSVDFSIKIEQGASVLLNYKPEIVPTSENVVVIKRFMVINNNAANVTLRVW